MNLVAISSVGTDEEGAANDIGCDSMVGMGAGTVGDSRTVERVTEGIRPEGGCGALIFRRE